MKRLIYFLFLMVSLQCAAQDEVVFHNGNIAKVKVSEVTEICIKFTYEGEDAMNIIGRAAIAEVCKKKQRRIPIPSAGQPQTVPLP